MSVKKKYNEKVSHKFRETAEQALDFFPELADEVIYFKITNKIKKSVMIAQPSFWSLLNPFKPREYVIKSSPEMKFSNESFKMDELPENVLKGWLVHELGHIMDYRDRSFFELIWFGFAYLSSRKFMVGAERRADEIAISHGTGEYILATKNFILDHASIREKYKERIRKLYMSPEEAMELISEISEGKSQNAPTSLHS